MAEPDEAVRPVELPPVIVDRGAEPLLVLPEIPFDGQRLPERRILLCFGKCHKYGWHRPIKRNDRIYFRCIQCGFENLYLIVRPIRRKELK